MTDPIDPATKLTVTLEAQQWNAVMSVLSDAPVPYRVVAPLIQTIGSQLQAAVNAPLQNGVMSPNQARDLEGLPPVPEVNL